MLNIHLPIFFIQNYLKILRIVTIVRSGRPSYGDTTIGYVCVKKEGETCIVKAAITPKHKVRHTNYKVITIINEKEGHSRHPLFWMQSCVWYVNIIY